MLHNNDKMRIQNGNIIFTGGNAKLREELNLHPVSSDISSNTHPFQGKRLRFIDGYWQGIKDGGSEYVDDLKEMVQNPFDIAINLVDLIKAVKKDPTLASEIGEAKLNEWSVLYTMSSTDLKLSEVVNLDTLL